MKHIRLKFPQYLLVSIAMILITVSGIGWMLSRIITQKALLSSDFSSSFELLLMKAHGFIAYLFIYAIGSMFWHIIEGWHAGRNRISGIALSTSVFILAVTGWGLYYLGSDSAREYSALIHEVTGCFIACAFLFHQRRSFGTLRLRFLKDAG